MPVLQWEARHSILAFASVILSFFFSIPVFAAANCCVYIHDTTTLGDPAALPKSYSCYNQNGQQTGTTDATKSYECPAGSAPETVIDGAFYLHDQELSINACGSISGYTPILKPKNNLYCTTGIKNQKETALDTPDDSFLTKLNSIINAVYSQAFQIVAGSNCCVPFDKSKTPDIICAPPQTRSKVAQQLTDFFFADGIALPGSTVEASFYCGSKELSSGKPDNTKLYSDPSTWQEEDKYKLFANQACNSTDIIPDESIPAYYQSLVSLQKSVGALCGSLSGVPEKKDGPKQEQETPSLFLPDASSLNPLGPITIQQYLGRIIKLALGVIGSIAFVMFIYGGVMWMTAGGNSDREGKSFETLFWAGMGVVVILASYALVDFVFEAFR